MNGTVCDGCWQWGDGPHACEVLFTRGGESLQAKCSCQVFPGCAAHVPLFRDIEPQEVAS